MLRPWRYLSRLFVTFLLCAQIPVFHISYVSFYIILVSASFAHFTIVLSIL